MTTMEELLDTLLEEGFIGDIDRVEQWELTSVLHKMGIEYRSQNDADNDGYLMDNVFMIEILDHPKRAKR